MSKRDYYDILGLTKDADPDAIKKAYRQAALQHHPDRNQGDVESETKFKEASEAYEVLSDPEKRARYDSFGNRSAGDFNIGDIFGAPRWNNGNIPRKGDDIPFNVTIELKDVLEPIQRTIHVRTDDFCPDCAGRGLKSGKSKTQCKDCKGTGVITNYSMQGNMRFQVQQHCGRCYGQGNVIAPEDRCIQCNNGKIPVIKETTVTIPPGISPEFSLRVSGLGKTGHNGGPRGDVFLRVNIKPHERFKRVQNNPNDLILELPISFVQACLGDKISVEMLDEKQVEITVPPYSQNGHTILLEKQGVPSLVRKDRGSLWVRFNVQVPTDITDEQLKLLKKFEEIEKGKNVHQNDPNERQAKSSKSLEEKVQNQSI